MFDQRDTWTDSQRQRRREDQGAGQSAALLPPGALRVMRKGRAAILLPECKPVLADLPAIWKRPGHQPRRPRPRHGPDSRRRQAPCGDPAGRRSHASPRPDPPSPRPTGEGGALMARRSRPHAERPLA